MGSSLISPPKKYKSDLAAWRTAEGCSAEIDNCIKAERMALRNYQPIKVLLLGQSESGKSTALRNFQMLYASKAWTTQRTAWRAIILLNLVRSVRAILDILANDIAGTPHSDSEDGDDSGDDYLDASGGARSLSRPSNTISNRSSMSDTQNTPKLAYTDAHRLLLLRLAPVRDVERDLQTRLGSGSTEALPPPGGYASENSGNAFNGIESEGGRGRKGGEDGEFYVQSGSGWTARIHPNKSGDTEYATAQEYRIVASLAPDIASLWADPAVRALLARRRVFIEDLPGFFLDDVERVAATGYEPTDGDVLRARLRTVGVQEWKFEFDEDLHGHSRPWHIYDVGGARTSRAAWAPYFDDVHAVIFLAPISAFDEALSEVASARVRGRASSHRVPVYGPYVNRNSETEEIVRSPGGGRVNRLQDTLDLWRATNASPLLRHAHLVLFLNKVDLLQRKLARGLRLSTYVRDYKGGENFDDIADYFRRKFKEVQQQASPPTRVGFWCHFTSVIDPQATAVTLVAMRDGIARMYLHAVDLL